MLGNYLISVAKKLIASRLDLDITKNFIKKENLEKGDVLVCNRDNIYYHFGLYMGDNKVIHFKGDPLLESEAVNPTVNITTLEEFAHGNLDLVLVEKPLEGLHYNCPSRSIRRAKRLLGKEIVLKNKYNLFTNNCEHFVMWCVYNKPFSKQVDNYSDLLINKFVSLNSKKGKKE